MSLPELDLIHCFGTLIDPDPEPCKRDVQPDRGIQVYAWTNAGVVIVAGLLVDKMGNRLGLIMFTSFCLLGSALFALVRAPQLPPLAMTPPFPTPVGTQAQKRAHRHTPRETRCTSKSIPIAMHCVSSFVFVGLPLGPAISGWTSMGHCPPTSTL